MRSEIFRAFIQILRYAPEIFRVFVEILRAPRRNLDRSHNSQPVNAKKTIFDMPKNNFSRRRFLVKYKSVLARF